MQGRHPCYSKFKNFFTFRLSPFVSGFVYCAYLVYILTLIPKAFRYKDDAVENVRCRSSSLLCCVLVMVQQHCPSIFAHMACSSMSGNKMTSRAAL